MGAATPQFRNAAKALFTWRSLAFILRRSPA